MLTCVITPVATPGYLQANPPECAKDILNFNLIHILGYDDGWRSWFQIHSPGVQIVPRGLSVDSSLFAIHAALRGDGIFLGRRPFINTYLTSGELIQVFKVPHHLTAAYYLRQN